MKEILLLITRNLDLVLKYQQIYSQLQYEPNKCYCLQEVYVVLSL